MSETKNNPQQATSYASGLSLPSLTPYTNNGAAISVSNGAAAVELTAILSQTGELMTSFEASLKADAQNILSASTAYETADQETKKAVQQLGK